MSTQSGITVSQELNESFRSLPPTSALIIKISPDSTELIPDKTITSNTSASLFADLNSHISSQFPDPAYIVISSDDQDDAKSFISFIPDVAKLRSKMLYASTRNTIINSLGSGIGPKVAFSELDELTWDSFQKSIASDDNAADVGLLLTEDEKILQGINNLSSFGNHGYKKKLASMGGEEDLAKNQDILYKFDPELTAAFDGVSSTDADKLIVFNIDLAAELVKLQTVESGVGVNQLVKVLDGANAIKSPQYSVYAYRPGSLAFIYSCPSGSAVKDRMVYAAFKNSLINHLKGKLAGAGVAIDKNLEVGDLDELELSELQSGQQEEAESVDSSSSSSKTGLKFNKPKGPRRR
ncbi:Twinfilin-1 [Candida viswanathii]|uniref:Twinfilin-1 n=1 Tax=Candida viswanathii TaxID=5486 RepID=A0A367YQ96_9ASCO|nr:Twinfilin-1 [Candida viswanathii]